MNSQFNKETSEGYYSFDQDEVFEALTMWCAKKGITLDKDHITSYTTQTTDKNFVVQIDFNRKY